MLKNGFVVALLACAVALQEGGLAEANHHAKHSNEVAHKKPQVADHGVHKVHHVEAPKAHHKKEHHKKKEHHVEHHKKNHHKKEDEEEDKKEHHVEHHKKDHHKKEGKKQAKLGSVTRSHKKKAHKKQAQQQTTAKPTEKPAVDQKKTTAPTPAQNTQGGSKDTDVVILDDASYSYDGSDDFFLDESDSGFFDFDFEESGDGFIWFDASEDMDEGSMDMSFDGSEDFEEDIDVGTNEQLDELIDLPKGASKFRLRVQKGRVNVDIYTKDGEEQPHHDKKGSKKQVKGLALAAQSDNKHHSKNILELAQKWMKEGYKTPAVLVAGVAAAAAIVVAIVAVIATRGSSSSPRSVLAIENGEPTEADLEVDEEAADSTPVLEVQEDEDEEEEEGVVEASV